MRKVRSDRSARGGLRWHRWSSGRQHGCCGRAAAARRTLRFEPLENRTLLAADLLVRFEFTDLSGTPVGLLRVGDDFLLKTYVQDIRQQPAGVFQAYFDINYNAALLSSAGAVTHGPQYQGAASADTTTDGLVDEVGGMDTDQVAPVPPGAEYLLFSVPLHADAAGTLQVNAELADGPSHTVQLFDTTTPLALDQIQFQGGTIEITSAGITVTPTTGLSTTEGGGTAAFSVVLTSPPTADVTIGLSSSDPTEGTAAPASLTFTPSNWDTPQTVTITGVDDAFADGNVAYTIVTAAATSSDPNYNGLDAADVSVTNQDDEPAPQILVTPSSGLVTTESGGIATFAVVLSTQPTAEVTLGVSSSDPTEGTVSVTTLTFTPENWNTPQTVTITGVDDAVVDGNVAYTIVLDPATSADPNYHGLDPTDVAVTNNDHDTATLTMTAVSASQSEGTGGTTTPFTFQVMLSGAVAGGFSLAYSTQDGTATVADGDYVDNDGTIVFAGNDGETHTITVLVNQDAKVERDEAFSVVLGALSNIDPTAAARISTTGSPLPGTILNDDATTVTLAGVSQTEGTGGTTTAYAFTVTLSNAVQGGFTIAYTTNDGTATVADNDYIDNDGSLVFSGTAGETKTITVEVKHDNKVERDETFTVALGAISGLLDSAMAQNIGSSGSPATGTIANDDLATVVFGTATGTAIEGAATHTVPVRLVVTNGGTLSESVTVSIVDLLTGTASAPADYSLATQQVTFEAGSSDGAVRTVQLATVADTTAEPGETVNLKLQVAGDGIGGHVSPGTTDQYTLTITDDPQTASISGVVWVDHNHNGRFDAGEPTVPGVTITLAGKNLANQDVEIIIMTDATGAYRFANLPAGTYSVIQTQPLALYDGPESLGTIDGAARGSAANDRFNGLVLDPGKQAVDYHFGEWGLKARYVNARLFLASAPAPNQALQERIATAEQQEGDPGQAEAVRRGEAVTVRRIGNEVTLIGTGTADSFEVIPAASNRAPHSAQHTVVANGIARTFSAATVNRIRLSGGGGADRAELHDSRHNDALEAKQGTATLAYTDFWLEASLFETIRAIAESGGTNTVKREAADFVLQLDGPWQPV